MSTFCPAKRAYLLRHIAAPQFGLIYTLAPTPCLCDTNSAAWRVLTPLYAAELGTGRFDALASWSPLLLGAPNGP